MKNVFSAFVLVVSMSAAAFADGERLLAHEFAKKAIVTVMKSPSQTKVCPWGDLKAFNATNVWKGDEFVENAVVVKGYLDAPNSFGVMLRSKWEVIVVGNTVVGVVLERFPVEMFDGYRLGMTKQEVEQEKALAAAQEAAMKPAAWPTAAAPRELTKAEKQADAYAKAKAAKERRKATEAERRAAMRN